MERGGERWRREKKRVENKIGRTINLILNNRPSVLSVF
jgi:hypothetical protein